MSKEKKTVKKRAIAKKGILEKVTAQLNTSLTSLKVQLGEKKFKKRIKKAAKKLVAGIKKTAKNKAVTKPVKAKPVRKKTAKPSFKK